MKKPKVSLDSAKMKAFLLNHVEKIVLGLFIGAMLLLIWQGFSLPGMDANKKPASLISQSDQAMQFIDNPERWEEIKEARFVPLDVGPKVNASQTPSEPAAYALGMQWNKPDFPKLSPRTDPEILAPQKLVLVPMIGPLAVFAKMGDIDSLAGLPTDEAPLKKKAVKKKAAPVDEYSGDGGMPGGDMYTPKRGSKKKKAGAGAYAAEGGMPGDGGYGGGMPGGGLSGDYGYGGGTGMPGMPYQQAMEVGYMPQAVEMTIAKNVHAVTILATVPYQKQMEEYERIFTNALDYDPSRDQFPWYIAFYVQRADVSDNPDEADPEKLDWKSIGVKRALIEAVGDPGSPGDPTTNTPPKNPTMPVWAGFPNDVADPSYLEPGVLTHPAPPFLARDLWPLLVHPDVPLLSMTAQYGMPGATDGTAAGAANPAAAQNEDAPPAPAFMPGAMPGGGMMSGDGGGYGGGMPGGGMPGGGMPGGMPGGGGYGGMSGGGYGGMSGGGYGGMSGGGMYGGGSADGGYGGGGGMYGGGAGMYGGGEYGSGAMTYTPPKYKMIRFTDTSVQPGHKYRYRLRVLLNDPNHPYPTMIAPSLASLADDVRKRVKPLDDADLQKAKAAGQQLLAGQSPQRSVYWVESPWSEPSDPVELPTPGRVFASKVKPATKNSEPRADALAVAWDPNKVADIAVEQEGKVVRGSVLNFKQKDLKVIHPVDKRVVTLPDEYSVSTNLLVADIMGGEPFPQLDRSINPEALTAPGELLIFDPKGNLRVKNEVEDIEGYRRFTVQKEDPKQAAAAASALDGGATTDDGYGRPQRGRRD